MLQPIAVDELCELLGSEGENAELLCAFAREFYAKVPRRLLTDRSLAELAAIARGSFHFLERAGQNQVYVEVLDPEEEGWEAPVTVIRAAVSDRPFIVDTIREFFNSENLPIRHYVYPVLRVKRREDGSVAAIMDPAGSEARSLVHCEVPRIVERARREEIARELTRRLNDVVLATDDFPAMIEAVAVTERLVAGYRERFADGADDFAEIEAFLRWLVEGYFVFLGYRAYEIVESGGEEVLRVAPGSGIGLLRQEQNSAWAEGVPLSSLSEELRRRVTGGPVLITSKTNAESTVHRRARMDYIGVKSLAEDGRIVGERRFIGLFTSKAYAEDADAIPILRRKLQLILDRSGATPGSHDYKEIITIFNSMPKEDLFQASIEELDREVHTVLAHLFADEVRLTLRSDHLGRGVSVMVILPRGKFSAEVRGRIQEALVRRFGGDVLNYHLALGAGDQARLHFHLASSAEVVRAVDVEDVTGEIREIIRSWDDRLIDELTKRFGAAEAHTLAALYCPAFQEEYRAANLPEVAVRDIGELERLRRSGERVAITLREPRGRGRAEVFRHVTILKLYLADEILVLSDFMPILDNAGLRVLEVAPYALTGPDLGGMMMYAFAVQDPEVGRLPEDRAALLAEALLAVRAGDTPSDLFTALVLRAGLRWREVDVIRTYANYAFQSGLVPTRVAMARALIRYPRLARLIFELFRARFDPAAAAADPTASAAALSAIREEIHDALDSVGTLSEDRAIRRIVGVVEATVRTNYFRHGAADPTARSGGVPYISVKIHAPDLDEMRRSRLLYEIFVFSSRMEGIHLRGAAVSRGGIRWSDRPDDFRTEVLGLVQTQIVKNAVIVPGGSKGGFITKRSFADRDEMMAEAAEQYRTLIRGMLDVTDNLLSGEVVPPPDVVRLDGDDPYLVVAADKGTAHLSDVANAVAGEYGFWLADAFASGGSHGYDHKREGITARGAWECVRRHFREMGKDIQKEPFTVVGVGDMGGDVFGNGMLLSRQIRLLAAFDHRHVFIDPDPDPERSYVERERIFRLGRSTWEDYDRNALSPGAMIVPRASKEVRLTPEARAALGIDASVEALDGEGLVRAVLMAPAELLWNGGIGTYVKAAMETNAEVGDPGNDPVRVDAHDLRCGVIGEGGNLGLTQRARIVYGLRGGRLNTDALDNSAGVDMSDHEVNLKILLAPRVAAGEMEFDERNRLLEGMTEEVSRLVLRNNFNQSLAVSLDEARSRESLGDFAALITAFERDRLLERTAEGIPSSDELAERAQEGLGLTRPTLCVLLAYAKLHAGSHLLASALPDDPATEDYLVGYFPAAAVEAVGIERLREHRLRREIVTTQLVNDLVDLMGASFLHRVSRDTGASIDAVVGAWYIASRISGAAEIREDLAEMEAHFPAAAVNRWRFGLARVLERTTTWTLANVAPDAHIESVVAELRPGLALLRGEFSKVVTGADRTLFEERMRELEEIGVDGLIAARIMTLRFLPELLDILRIAGEAGSEPIPTARVYYVASDELGIAWLQQALRAAPQADVWEQRLAQALVADLQRAHRTISRRVLEARRQTGSDQEALDAFRSRHPREAQQYEEVVEALHAVEQPLLPACAVAIRLLGELARE